MADEINKTMKIMKNIRQIGMYMKKIFQMQYKDINITGPQGMLIGTLAHCGDMKISDLSKEMELSNSTVSGIVDRLEKQGAVERVRSKEDRRVVHVRLTEDCRKDSDEKFKKVTEYINGKVNRATPEEIDQVLNGLEILKKILE